MHLHDFHFLALHNFQFGSVNSIDLGAVFFSVITYLTALLVELHLAQAETLSALLQVKDISLYKGLACNGGKTREPSAAGSLSSHTFSHSNHDLIMKFSGLLSNER